MSLILYFFYGVLILTLSRLFTQLILSGIYNVKGKGRRSEVYPKISLVVPAYNEEKTIGCCIKSLLGIDYPDYEIVVVDDGSIDRTLEEARKFESSGVKVVHQANQGKANALNNGIRLSEGEVVITVDADTKLHPESLTRIASRFASNQRLGAVAGNVKVTPNTGIMNALQATEYTTGINLIRKAQSMLGCVMVVPGPMAAFRRKIVERVGFLSDDTFAEDFDITMRILKDGYRVEYEDEAIAYTDAPRSVEDLMKQRRRWYRGMMQVLEKHRDMYLSRKHGVSGMLGVPSMWFETVSPFLNIFLVLITVLTSLTIGESLTSLTGLALFLGVELAVEIFAIGLDSTPKARELVTAPLLILYNVFLDGVRMMAFTEEVIGVVMKWEKPKRS